MKYFVFILIFFVSCGIKKMPIVYPTLVVRDSVVMRWDTAQVHLPGSVVRVRVMDTALVRGDTIYQTDPQTGLLLRLWRDKYHALVLTWVLINSWLCHTY